MSVSKDPYGQPNELYKAEVADEALLKAVTILINKIKESRHEYQSSMDLCH